MLPAITLAIFQLTLIMRLVRAEMLEVLRTDYIKFARARGLSDRAIHFGHALKNTLVPVMTITGLQLGGLIAFAIITETVFQWPGMGLLFIQAVTFADIPVMAAYLCLIALIFVVINLVVDLLYFVVDPRLRIGQRGRALMTASHVCRRTAGRSRTSRASIRRSPLSGATCTRIPNSASRRSTPPAASQEALQACGVDEIHTGIGKTGVVGVIRGRVHRQRPHDRPARRHGCACRCARTTTSPGSSAKHGLMHGCGHDGHTAMLVGAARYLAETRNFDGTAVLIFQPGEEGFAGARAMIEDGLFDRFPVRVGLRHAQLARPAGRHGRHQSAAR